MRVAPQRAASSGRGWRVLPQHVAGARVERLHDVAGMGEKHHPVVHEGRGLAVALLDRDRPREPQAADGVAVDLVEGAVPVVVEGPPPARPVGRRGLLQQGVGDRGQRQGARGAVPRGAAGRVLGRLGAGGGGRFRLRAEGQRRRDRRRRRIARRLGLGRRRRHGGRGGAPADGDGGVGGQRDAARRLPVRLQHEGREAEIGVLAQRAASPGASLAGGNRRVRPPAARPSGSRSRRRSARGRATRPPAPPRDTRRTRPRRPTGPARPGPR